MRPSSPVPIIVGVATAVVGFLVIVVAWTSVAGQTAVADQLPVIVGGGLGGLALVMVGLTVVVVQSRRIEGNEQARQVAQVAAAVAAFTESLSPSDDDRFSVATPDGTEDDA